MLAMLKNQGPLPEGGPSGHVPRSSSPAASTCERSRERGRDSHRDFDADRSWSGPGADVTAQDASRSREQHDLDRGHDDDRPRERRPVDRFRDRDSDRGRQRCRDRERERGRGQEHLSHSHRDGTESAISADRTSISRPTRPPPSLVAVRATGIPLPPTSVVSAASPDTSAGLGAALTGPSVSSLAAAALHAFRVPGERDVFSCACSWRLLFGAGGPSWWCFPVSGEDRIVVTTQRVVTASARSLCCLPFLASYSHASLRLGAVDGVHARMQPAVSRPASIFLFILALLCAVWIAVVFSFSSDLFPPSVRVPPIVVGGLSLGMLFLAHVCAPSCWRVSFGSVGGQEVFAVVPDVQTVESLLLAIANGGR
eukprot:TRINITY_DN3637_c0_g1_i1.p1 TRINITY_DN3637_c0_g1~~TRINITY_DN3637_c0_g1_i1.p1  ORF type:complete len:369 (+),score=11.76 TRINITY_DN3637_c0_g1_i1:225-1331(+)